MTVAKSATVAEVSWKLQILRIFTCFSATRMIDNLCSCSQTQQYSCEETFIIIQKYTCAHRKIKNKLRESLSKQDTQLNVLVLLPRCGNQGKIDKELSALRCDTQIWGEKKKKWNSEHSQTDIICRHDYKSKGTSASILCPWRWH